MVFVVNQKVKEKKALLFRMSTNHLDIVNDIFIVLARLWSNQVRMQECGNVYILGTRHSFISQTKIDTHHNLETQYIYKIILVYWYINAVKFLVKILNLLYCYITFLPIKELWTLKQYYILIYFCCKESLFIILCQKFVFQQFSSLISQSFSL